jgi:serine/threonine-protein kinase HipA
MARFSETLAADRVELFRRMAFNCCISNTDDHERNHGFLAGDAPGLYTLSPAYDLVPRQHATRRREHALAIGEEGFVATRQNILSESAVFGLTRAQAEDILDEIARTVQGRWKQGLMDEGIGEQEADDWAVCFTPLPDSL